MEAHRFGVSILDESVPASEMGGRGIFTAVDVFETEQESAPSKHSASSGYNATFALPMWDAVESPLIMVIAGPRTLQNSPLRHPLRPQ